jgi:hypothetical protein
LQLYLVLCLAGVSLSTTVIPAGLHAASVPGEFVALKPKSAAAVKGTSVMQPLGVVKGEEGAGGGLAELGGDAFAVLAEVQVEPSEIFLQRWVCEGAESAAWVVDDRLTSLLILCVASKGPEKGIKDYMANA